MCVCVCLCVCMCVCVCVHQCACRTLQCTQTLSMKKRLTPYVFVYIYKLLHVYICIPLQPYKHVPRMHRERPWALGAPREPLGSLRTTRYDEKLEVCHNHAAIRYLLPRNVENVWCPQLA